MAWKEPWKCHVTVLLSRPPWLYGKIYIRITSTFVLTASAATRTEFQTHLSRERLMVRWTGQYRAQGELQTHQVAFMHTSSNHIMLPDSLQDNSQTPSSSGEALYHARHLRAVQTAQQQERQTYHRYLGQLLGPIPTGQLTPQ